MNKLTKGALAMVIVGSVTFSVTNALLADHSSKRLAQANDLTNSGDQKKADDINQIEKTVKDQAPTTDVKDVQPTYSHNIAVLQAVLNNGNKSDKAIAVIQKNTKTISDSSTSTNTPAPVPTITTNSSTPTTGTTSTKSATITAAKNSTATTNSTTKAITTTPTTPTTMATKTTNHGKQVSQAAKEKAASHQIKKINY